MIDTNKKEWWKNAVFYEIYPKSFLDTNGDGIGDIRGIIQKLDYFSYLGIDALWLCPVYSSPMKDNGYDISDYYNIHPDFGSKKDIKELVKEANKRNIYIIMDLVVNHCSDQHPWFQDVKKNENSPYRDYFIIRQGDGDNPPNNWRSVFGGSVWEKLKGNEYYYHTFTKEQPDLNWECSRMRHEIYEMMKYWLDIGIKGFRVDAITYIKKEPDMRTRDADGPDGLAGLAEVSENYPGIEDFLEEMKQETFQKYDAFSVAEISRVKDEMLKKMIGKGGLFSSIFDFSYLDLDVKGDWYLPDSITADRIKAKMNHSQEQAQSCGGYLSVVLENHDENRSVGKFIKSGEYTWKGAAMLATWNLTLRGFPFLYQGEEIGMTNREWKSMSEFDDVWTPSQFEMALKTGLNAETAFQLVSRRSRDNSRTPMQWDCSENAGFTTGTPWILLNDNYKKVNVKSQMGKQGSLLEYYRQLIQLRKSQEYGNVLTEGSISFPECSQSDLIVYIREIEGKQLLIILNFSDKEVSWPSEFHLGWNKIMGNYECEMPRKNEVLLPYEAAVLERML